MDGETQYAHRSYCTTATIVNTVPWDSENEVYNTHPAFMVRFHLFIVLHLFPNHSLNIAQNTIFSPSALLPRKGKAESQIVLYGDFLDSRLSCIETRCIKRDY